MINRNDVYAVIDGERDYQDEMPGNHDSLCSISDWIIFMENKLAEAKLNIYELNEAGALHSIRKVTALGVACMEHHGAPRRVPGA